MQNLAKLFFDVPYLQNLHSVYRYTYNGMEADHEISGHGNSYTTQFRQYDPRLGRWKSLDPLAAKYPGQSPFNAFNNNPVYYTDPLGLEGKGRNKKEKKSKENGSQNEAGSASDAPVNVDENVSINTSDTKFWNDGNGYTVVTPNSESNNPGGKLNRLQKRKDRTFGMKNGPRKQRVQTRRQENYTEFKNSNRYENWLSKTPRDSYYAFKDGGNDAPNFSNFGNYKKIGAYWNDRNPEYNKWGFQVAVVKSDGSIVFETIGYTTDGTDLYWKEGNSFGQPSGSAIGIGPENEIYDNTAVDSETVLITPPTDLNSNADQIVPPGMEYLFFAENGVSTIRRNDTGTFIIVRTELFTWQGKPGAELEDKRVSKIIPITK